MKKFFLFAVAFLALPACVSAPTAVDYAQRAHPDCSGFHSINHSYSSGGNSPGSQTEVGMVCADDGAEVERSITVKCIHGWGVISDTTCHENN